VLALIDNTPDIGPKGGKEVVFNEVKGNLTLENVHFAYQMRPDQMVLKGVTLEIKAGQTLALVGRSGGGKSTLVHLLMRFYDPKSGRILLDGTPLPELNLLSLHRCMGLVQQETQLFAMSIEHNIGYGTENYTMEQVYEAAKLANCHDFIMEFDDGYQTRVGERGVRLSGGQKQRIAIARVLMRRPRLLFLDEATSALDTESEAAVQTALDNLIKLAGCTVVLVAHRLSTVVNADKIAVVHSGQIIEQGTHQELLDMKGAYARLVSRQITRERNQIDNDGNKPKEIAIDALLLEEEEEKNPNQKKKAHELDMVDSLLAEELEEKKKEPNKPKPEEKSEPPST
jgi:ATP-binding cassette subfamily B protein